jgi:hypothetical protein
MSAKMLFLPLVMGVLVALSGAVTSSRAAGTHTSGVLQAAHVDWPLDQQGPANISLINGRLWVSALSGVGQPTQFRVNNRLHVSSAEPQLHSEHVIGARPILWGVGTDPLTADPTVEVLDEVAGRVTRFSVPRSCRATGGGSIVFRGDLWVDCIRAVAVLDPTHGFIRTSLIPRLLGFVESRSSIWAVQPGQLSSIGGVARRPIKLPRRFISDTSGDRPAWASRGNDAWAVGIDNTLRPTLLHVNLNTGFVTTFQPRDLPPTAASIALVGSELWLGDARSGRVLRYQAAHPRHLVGSLKLNQSHATLRTMTIIAQSNHSGWAVVNSMSGFDLYRLQTPESSS